MNDLTHQILPNTRAVIWFPQTEIDENSVHYRNVDYLCDGILTSSLSSLKNKSSLVLIGKNFGASLMIYVARSLVKNEFESFMNLISKDEAGDILVVDDAGLMPELKSLMPAASFSKLKRVN